MMESTNTKDESTYSPATASPSEKGSIASSTSTEAQRTVQTSRQTGDLSVRVTTRALNQNSQTDK